MNDEIIKYVQLCPEYQCNTAAKHKSDRLLQLLEPAYIPWHFIAIAFIANLPLSEGCDQHWVIIDRYTKMESYILLKKKNKKGEDLATIFAREIWKLDGIPVDIMSDQGLEVYIKILEVFNHQTRYTTMDVDSIPSTNRQLNRLHKSDDRNISPIVYKSTATDWVELLPLAEFAYNNNTTCAHGMIPFDTNYSYKPTSGTISTQTNILLASLLAYEALDEGSCRKL
jgi:hypothetical protein